MCEMSERVRKREGERVTWKSGASQRETAALTFPCFYLNKKKEKEKKNNTGANAIFSFLKVVGFAGWSPQCCYNPLPQEVT